MERRDFFHKNLIYLLSFDLDLGLRRREAAVPGRVITSMAHDFRDGPRQPVYNALGERRVLGEEAPRGGIEFAQEGIRYLPNVEFAEIFGRLVIRTAEDDFLIEAQYKGIARAGRRWLAVRNSYASEDMKPVCVKAHIHARFETGCTKYRWLVQRQCVGYGNLCLHRGEPSSGTFDIYAIDSETRCAMT